MAQVRPHLEDRHTIVSIAAGITLASLKASAAADAPRLASARLLPRLLLLRMRAWRLQCALRSGLAALAAFPLTRAHIRALQAAAGDNARVVRVMPNTPCLVGETAAAM